MRTIHHLIHSPSKCLRVLGCTLTALFAAAAGAQTCPADGGAAARGCAEIQIFFGYRGYNDYDHKVVSMQNRPLSLAYIYDGPSDTAACYKGNPQAAIDLFATMIDRYNAETWRGVRLVRAYADPTPSGRGALHLWTRDEGGAAFLDFPRMIECDRWSTPEEQAHY